jgi:hypothetical protein
MTQDVRRPTGRPPLKRGQPSANLHTVVTAAEFDAVCSRAAAQQVSLSAWVRQTIVRRIRAAGEDDDDDE